MKIGLTQRVLFHKKRAYDSIEHGWYSYLKGHTLFPIANRIDQDFKQLAESLDCLIITGGDDSVIRRTCEIKLATAMMLLRKPIIGICHGCFLLTDLLGGLVEPIDNHMDTFHEVTYMNSLHSVNSFHTQYIKTAHNSATILATDADGNCEAWIDITCNIAGVVWHPERMKKPWLPEEINKLLTHSLNTSIDTERL